MAKVTGGKAKVEFFGSSELLKKLEKAGANVEKEVAKALQQSIQKPKNEMLDYIRQHKLTGDTEKSFVEEIEINKNIVNCTIGFSVRKGGLPAIFLNLGTPKIDATFFIDKAIENNIDEIKRVQLEVLQNAFKELS